MKKTEELLESLVCPVTKQKLEYNKETNEFISKEAKLAFPIVDGIPIMLIERARKVE